tara:strand:+ start:1904 stop:3523 length:1620 start_codon:yes stop_codon:yes gene_type:complete
MDNFNIHSFFKKQYLNEAEDDNIRNDIKSLEKEYKLELEKEFNSYSPSISMGFYGNDRPDEDKYKGKGYGSIGFYVKEELSDEDWKKALDWVKSKGYDIVSDSNYYEKDIDDDRAWYPKIKFEFDANKKSSLNESRIDQSKVFDQSEVDEIIGEIKEITGIGGEDQHWSSDAEVGYSEYRFGDGTGGFSFKWSHARNWGGRFGLSISENGKNNLSALSWYDKSKSGSENIKSSNTNVQNITTWKDLDNSMLVSIWAQLQPMVIQNEINAKAALSKEAKAQSDYYSKKADTGRIGYGLSSQPRMRNESVEDIKDLEDRLAQLYREMEQEAEPEGGPISDQYADAIHKIESEISSLKPKKPSLTYNQAIGQEEITDETGTFVYDRDGRKAYKKISVDDFNKSSKFDRNLNEAAYPSFEVDKNIRYQDTIVTKGYWTYTGKESGGRGVYLNTSNQQRLGFDMDDLNYFKKHLPDHFQINEGSCGYTPDGKPRTKPASSDLLKLEDVIKECWKNYKQVGMKEKGGKQVPNCVPVKENNTKNKR